MLKVDSTSAKGASTDLDKLSQSGDRAEVAVQGVGAASNAAKPAISGVGQAAATAAAAQGSLADAARRVAVQLQTNPGAYSAGLTTVAQQAAMAKAALDAVNRASLQVRPFGGSFAGPLQRELGQTAKAVDQVTKAQDGLGKSSAAVVTATAAATTATKALGNSAAQTAHAMRMLPAQITDITVGLTTGQSPFMVLMQQGGQLKDMFGGIGPAVRALGGYILGLIGPISVMAAAVGILTVAWVKGDAEARKFNEAIVMTGNYAGVTADSLSGMARSISGSVGTTGKAADTLAKLVETGRLAGDTIEGLGRAAILMEQATGKSVDETVKEYQRIAEAPAEALAKLNEQYHFLDVATYQRVASLQEEGRQQDAARVALETYSKAIGQRAGDVKQNLGTLESAWNSVKGAAKGAWDAMLDIGRPAAAEDLIAKMEKEVRQRRDVIDNAIKAGASVSPGERASLTAAEGRVALAKQQLQTQLAIAKAQALDAQRSAVGIAARAELNKLLDQGASKEEKRAKALAENEERIRRIRAGGGAVTEEEVKASTAAILKQFEDKASGGSQISSATRLLQSLREQGAALQAQLESEEKLGSVQKQRAEFEQKILDLKDKQGKLSADEKDFLAKEGLLRATLQENEAREKSINLRRTEMQLEAMRAAAAATLATDNQRYEDALGAFASDNRTREMLQGQQQIYRDYQRQMQQAARDFTRDGDREKLDAQTAILRKSLSDRLEAQREYYANLEQLEGRWQLGAQGGLADYAEMARNVAGNTRSAFFNAFKGMEDALVQFVTTGKASFGSLVQSILADIARLAIQQGVTGPLSGWLGGVMKGLAAGLGGGAPTAGQLAGATQGVNAGLPLAFATGGYTGDKDEGEVSGFVHGKEYVLNAAATRRIGRDKLDQINFGRMSLDTVAPAPVMASAGASAAGLPPKVIVNNMGTPQDYSVERLTRDEVILLARDQVYEQGPQMMAAQLNRPNSRGSRAMTNSFDVARKR